MAGTRQKTRICREQPAGRQGRRSKRKAYAPAWSADTINAKAYLGMPFYTSITEAPQELVERAFTEKYPWVAPFVDAGCPRGKLMEFARKHAALRSIPEDQIPAYTTLNTWAKRLKAFGAVGLIDKARPRRSRTVTDTQLGLIDVSLTDRPGYTPAASLLARHSPSDQPMPSYHAIRRAAKNLERENAHVYEYSRNGPLHFRNVFRTSIKQGLVPGGFCLLIDSTVADIWVRIRNAERAEGWEGCRPVLTVIQDVGTRMLVTYNLSLHAIDSGIILGVFGRAVCQARNYVGLHSTGLPYQISLDKGSEHQGVFRQTIERLGVKTVPSMPNSPQSQARVERLIGTITSEVFRNQDGYSKTEKVFDPYAPPTDDVKRTLAQLKYEPYRSEVPVTDLLRLEELDAKILAWATLYNRRPHGSLPTSSPDIIALLDDARTRDESGPASDDT